MQWPSEVHRQLTLFCSVMDGRPAAFFVMCRSAPTAMPTIGNIQEMHVYDRGTFLSLLMFYGNMAKPRYCSFVELICSSLEGVDRSFESGKLM